MKLENIQHFIMAATPTLLALWHYISGTVAMAISTVDKDNDGKLTDEEKEELAVLLVKQSKTIWVRALPEGIVRRVIRFLCSKRKSIFKK